MSVRSSLCDYSLTTGTKKPSYATYHKKVVLNCLEVSPAWADWKVLRETAIDIVFIDTSTTGKHELYALRNGLSGRDTQLLILNKGQKRKMNVILITKEKAICIL